MIEDEDDIYDAVRKYRDEHPELMNPVHSDPAGEPDYKRLLADSLERELALMKGKQQTGRTYTEGEVEKIYADAYDNGLRNGTRQYGDDHEPSTFKKYLNLKS